MRGFFYDIDCSFYLIVLNRTAFLIYNFVTNEYDILKVE